MINQREQALSNIEKTKSRLLSDSKNNTYTASDKGGIFYGYLLALTDLNVITFEEFRTFDEVFMKELHELGKDGSDEH